MRTSLSLLTLVVSLVMIGFQVPSAGADTIALAAHEQSATTADGGVLLVGQRNEKIQRVTNGTGLTREVLVDNQAYARVRGRGAARLRDATITLGYQVGCALAFGSLMLDMSGLATVLGLDPSPLIPQGQQSTITVIPLPQAPPLTEATLFPGMTVSPQITVGLTMGSIVDMPFASGPVRNSRALIGIHDTRIRVDGCLGAAAVRSYAVLSTKSALSDDNIVVYGDPVRM